MGSGIFEKESGLQAVSAPRKIFKVKHMAGNLSAAPEDINVDCLKTVWTEIYLKFYGRLRSKILGREDDDTIGTLELLLNAMFADGHLLFEDFPGSGKSYMATSLAELIYDDIDETGTLGHNIRNYKRIQCTPDLLPGDVTGFSMLENSTMRFQPGPVFAYFLLVDEINRTTPKVQSALLEAMAEKQVTVDGRTHSLGKLFFVVATENPLDQAGTFPLPQAQLDRFLFKRRLRKIDKTYEAMIMLMDEEPLLKGELSVRQKYFEDNYRKLFRPMIEKVSASNPGAHEKLNNAVTDFVKSLDEGEKLKDRVKTDKINDKSGTIRMTDILEGRDMILSKVKVHSTLIQKILEVSDTIENDKAFKMGSRPSVRSMQKFIKAAKVRAFVEAMKADRSDEVWAYPQHFRELAPDLLRHRVMFMDEDLSPDKRDDKISKLVNEVTKES